MLMAQALTGLLRLFDSRVTINSLSIAILLEKTPKMLTQVLWRTMSKQNPDGSWEQCRFPGETAYGVLTLVALQDFPWMNELKAQVQRSIEKSRGFLEISRSKLPGPSNEPQWKIEAALTGSYFILPELRNSHLVMFPRHEDRENKLLKFLAFDWITARNISLSERPFSNLLLWRETHVSMFTVQIDTYMESIVEKFENGLQ
ncbi:hypothetical protein HYFRA_00009670 [Hymenoscyphus fraxineus]|uniref:Uncharacterized protein n=1 Tax=Hymenoscyphus fraxineus TaxID=746836 RepID=A0A9N9PH36_9HELO|nr:hypothetical protein HYFRA_00009670 [Hymenoscyphus fraxineus]